MLLAVRLGRPALAAIVLVVGSSSRALAAEPIQDADVASTAREPFAPWPRQTTPRSPTPSGVPQGLRRGTFDDPALGPMPFDPEYRVWFGDDRREPRFVRAALEMGGLLAVGTAYYWFWPQMNQKDWIFPDLSAKFVHPSITFDNNMHRTNHILHPVGGTMYYWFSRVNGLDVYQSSLYSFLSSTFFEFVLEFRETASINDMIFTPAGGVSGGEFFFHLGDYLNSANGHENLAHRGFALTLGLPQYVHESVDGVENAPQATPDNLGFSSAYWHRFVLGYGRASVYNEIGRSSDLDDLLLEMELVAVPGFQRPGRFALPFHQGNFTGLRLRTTIGQGGLADVDLTVNASLAGIYGQDYVGSPEDLRGHAWMVAASVDTRYVDRWLLGRRDLFAVSHLLGPSTRFWWGLGSGFSAHAEADVHFDFTGMGSPTYQERIAENGPSNTKSILQMHGYYFGLGGSTRAAMSVGYRGLELGGRVAFGTYRSVQGFDQEQASMAEDATNADRIFELGGALRFSPPSAPLDVRLGWEERRHASRMGSLFADWRDRRAFATAGLRF